MTRRTATVRNKSLRLANPHRPEPRRSDKLSHCRVEPVLPNATYRAGPRHFHSLRHARLDHATPLRLPGSLRVVPLRCDQPTRYMSATSRTSATFRFPSRPFNSTRLPRPRQDSATCRVDTGRVISARHAKSSHVQPLRLAHASRTAPHLAVATNRIRPIHVDSVRLSHSRVSILFDATSRAPPIHALSMRLPRPTLSMPMRRALSAPVMSLRHADPRHAKPLHDKPLRRARPTLSKSIRCDWPNRDASIRSGPTHLTPSPCDCPARFCDMPGRAGATDHATPIAVQPLRQAAPIFSVPTRQAQLHRAFSCQCDCSSHFTPLHGDGPDQRCSIPSLRDWPFYVGSSRRDYPILS